MNKNTQAICIFVGFLISTAVVGIITNEQRSSDKIKTEELLNKTSEIADGWIKDMNKEIRGGLT